MSSALTFTVAFLLAIQQPLWAQNSLATAEAFIRTAYDELIDDSLGVSVTLTRPFAGNGLDWTRLPEVFVQLERGMPKGIVPPDEAELQLLGVSVLVDVFGRVSMVLSRGSYVHSRDLTDMIGFAEDHREWSDSDFVAELKRRNARFPGNVNEFAKGVRLLRFEPLFGRILKSDIRFNVRTLSGRADIPDSFRFTWVVDLETEPAPLERHRYILTFEPFDGRLLRLQHTVAPR